MLLSRTSDSTCPRFVMHVDRFGSLDVDVRESFTWTREIGQVSYFSQTRVKRCLTFGERMSALELDTGDEEKTSTLSKP